jgi:CDP-glucose 4,6-dehydratase
VGLGPRAVEDLERPGLSPVTEAALRASYRGRRVLLTGHTGFKGGWLAVLLAELGAETVGFALPPDTSPSLFDDARVAGVCRSVEGDVRDLAALRAVVREARPEVVLHLAAQPLVRASYERPIETWETNVLGTANVLEALRLERQRCAVVVVTTDKCYENREWAFGYREVDPVGGHDPYSASKAAAELVVDSYRRSFFPPAALAAHGVALASARAGNVIGGGDWARDRIVPDAVRALSAGESVLVRNPRSIRPWQHVLEPLGGYLVLGARLLAGDAGACEAWNFGPRPEATVPVAELVGEMVEAWGSGAWHTAPQQGAPHEAGVLRLAIEKAYARLGWAPRWSVREAIRHTVSWYALRARGAGADALRAEMVAQFRDYCGGGAAA